MLTLHQRLCGVNVVNMAAPAYGYDGQPPPGLKIMSVPERIQLSSSEPSAHPSEDPTFGKQYRPMKVPDKITLGEGGGVQGVAGRQPADKSPEPGSGVRGGTASNTAMTREDQFTSGRGRFSAQPPMGAQTEEDPLLRDSETGEQLQLMAVNQRLMNLEMKVQNLENTVARAGGRGGGPGRFWYILSFASWMMVPLIVVYMFHYKKNM